jgi:2-keto-myo-inositol isomerase
MAAKKRFALNRIISPSLGLEEFMKFAAAQGLSQVELRNDLPGRPNISDIIDGLKPAEALRIARGEGVRIIAINALQRFNLGSERAACRAELERLLELAAALECPAVVLCPNNNPADLRQPGQMYLDTVEALRDYGALFAAYGIFGYVEALGFGVSSLASLPAAVAAIKASGYGCYRALLDSFHHYIGPDNRSIFGMDGLGASYEIAYTGLAHISGVEDPLPAERLLDGNRVLVGPQDRLGNKALIRRLDDLGYLGSFSFEPFSPAVQKLPPDQLAAALKACFEYLEIQ